MRFFRLIGGLVVVLLAVWIIVGEQMAGASADAVINAEVVTLRADVAGTLDLQDRTLGSRVSQAEELASIEDALVDNLRLNDLRLERARAEAELAAARSMMEKTQAIMASLRARGETYRKERLTDLRTRLDHARNRLELLQEEGLPSAEGQQLVDGLDDGQDRLPFEPITRELALDHARERVAVLEIALRAAEAGVFLGDGYNDAPNAEQRVVELQSDLASFEAEAARAEAALEAVEERLAREQVRVNALRGGQITSPVEGSYWEVLQADGVVVQRGDPILRLVDCGSTMVTLSVTESIYNTLSPGQSAEFRLLGASLTFDATVARLAGSGAGTIYRNLAIAPSQRHLERYDVLLQVPELRSDDELGCAIGRTGRAFFDRRPLDWVRGLFG
ncbi:Multidrug resistance efflux pump [Tranquillimonas rosea]|uniref:Multidrug resistance efflux pump n=1 Tax=Tranquillimonas rosea TaxID=641238 RepID=A0A1H9PKL9_9RHOB|nr:HlyD family efflux transporter periplasmic adaptor subunit [Tranquillimonas rosea]SER48846.1 Multidrug resistance efflux pump [Tranquillimonas rosea]